MDRNENISVIKNNFRMGFHVKYEVGDRYLMSLKVVNVRNNLSCVTVKELHEKLGHPSVRRVINTAKDNNIKLSNKSMDPCESCELAKSRRVNLRKVNSKPVHRPGNRLYIDKSCVRQ